MKTAIVLALFGLSVGSAEACKLSNLRTSQIILQAALTDFSTTIGRSQKTRIRQMHFEGNDLVEIHYATSGKKAMRGVTLYRVEINPDCSANVIHLD